MPNTSDKYITDNKLAAANKSPSLSKKQTVPSREDGTVGIRSTLTNMGISNDLIGYDDRSGTVTLGGRTLMKPSYWMKTPEFHMRARLKYRTVW